MANPREPSGQSPPEVDTMWPATTQSLVRTDRRRQILHPTKELEHILKKDNIFADPKRFEELLRFSQPGCTHRDSLARLWENKQANAVSLLKEQIDTLKQRRIEAERQKEEILNEADVQQLYGTGDNDEEMLDPIAIGGGFLCDDGANSWNSVSYSASSLSENDGDNDSDYWRAKAKSLNQLLSDSLKREDALTKKLAANSEADLPTRVSAELHHQFDRLDNFLRFTLRRAPVVIGHQDAELRYLFCHNAFPTLTEEEVIGKTDEEIYQGAGVTELMDLKREVIRTGFPDKKEINFNTDLFGQKTFLIAVEPVFDITDHACIGVNYVAMDVTVQVAKREKLARLGEEDAVQVAMEKELNKTIDIQEETMRAKQLLATMTHEIRSPLAGVVSMASMLANTHLDDKQRSYVDLMIKSGEIVLQLINDILDLSKVEAGAMTFEARKFRPREVVSHVLRMCQNGPLSADKKNVKLEEDIADDVPVEVIGDVLRIRQVLTNLVSNAVKFTHTGKVSIVIRVRSSSSIDSLKHQSHRSAGGAFEIAKSPSSKKSQFCGSRCLGPVKTSECCQRCQTSDDVAKCLERGDHKEVPHSDSNPEGWPNMEEDGGTIWLHCDIVDTGIGIAETVIKTLFQRYAQASTTHAREYGGTGLGLAICKQLVELMGGDISVLSKEHEGSTFSFRLPLKVAKYLDASEGQLIGSAEPVKCVRDDSSPYENSLKTKTPGPLQFTSITEAPLHCPESDSQPPKASISTHGSHPDGKKKNFRNLRFSHNGEPILSSNVGGMGIAFMAEAKTDPSKEQVCSNSRHDISLGMNKNTRRFMDGPSHNNNVGCDSVTNETHARCPSQSRVRLSPGKGYARKLGKSRASDRRLASNDISPLPSRGAKQSRPCRVLLAEDSPVNVKVTTIMMQSLGHDLTVVSNGAEAIRALQQSSYDLILMDVYMPVMDGIEATRRIRKYERCGSWAAIEEVECSSQGAGVTKVFSQDHCGLDLSLRRRNHTPIIALTAATLVENIQHCFEIGMDDVIAKPVKLEDLEKTLRKHLDPSIEHPI